MMTSHSGLDFHLGYIYLSSLQGRHNERDGVSNHRRSHCLLHCWFKRKSKKTSKVRVTGLCVGNAPVTGEFPAPQKASNEENVFIWWRHHDICSFSYFILFRYWDKYNAGLTWWNILYNSELNIYWIDHKIFCITHLFIHECIWKYVLTRICGPENSYACIYRWKYCFTSMYVYIAECVYLSF